MNLKIRKLCAPSIPIGLLKWVTVISPSIRLARINSQNSIEIWSALSECKLWVPNRGLRFFVNLKFKVSSYVIKEECVNN
jgi:hypothetical protein